jgi:hypothetical protein
VRTLYDTLMTVGLVGAWLTIKGLRIRVEKLEKRERARGGGWL